MAGVDNLTTIPVYYVENGEKKRKDISFKGNFGFQLNDKKYTVHDGHVYNQEGKPLKSMGMDVALAYQFIGMSNTADSYQDYTYSQNDIAQAHQDKGSSCYQTSDMRTRTIIGTKNGVCRPIDGKTTCDGTTYTTKCKDNLGNVNTVSIWSANKQ